MAIENNFLHFNTEDTFQNQKSEIKDASIAFIKDSGKIYTHGEEYESVNWGEIKYNGVYVYTNKGELVNPESWDTANNDSAVGVAVIDDNARFAISKELPAVNDIPWSDVLQDTDVAGLTNYPNRGQALLDFNGLENTKIIMEAAPSEDSSNNAAYYCNAQTLNGKNGYLPAVGELALMHNNKTAIDSALTTIGSKTISARLNELQREDHYIWSSTESKQSASWYLIWNFSSLTISASNKTGNYANSNYFAFPFFPLNI